MTVFIPVSYLCRNMVVSYPFSYPVNANWFHTWFHTQFHTWFHTSPSPQIRQARSQAARTAWRMCGQTGSGSQRSFCTIWFFVQSWMRRAASGGLGVDSLRPVFFTRIRTFLDETLADSYGTIVRPKCLRPVWLRFRGSIETLGGFLARPIRTEAIGQGLDNIL